MQSDMLERLWKIQTSANELVLQGKREPDSYIEFLQKFVFGNALPDIDWQKTYTALGMSEYGEVVKNLAIKENPGFWFEPVVKGLTCNKVVAMLREVGVQVWTYVDDLNKNVPTNDRDPNHDGSYVVGFRRTIEADEENANKSANTLKIENHKGITLLERLLLELGYFLTTGQNLDVNNITLCTGSRYSYGNVPFVDFGSGKVRVDAYGPSDSSGRFRSRSAVS